MEAIRLGSIFQVGKYHLLSNTPCQDRALAVEKDALKILAISDGMGSYPNSHLGAEFVVDYITANADKFYSLLESPFDAVLDQLFFMQSKAEAFAKRRGMDLDELHCTLSFAIIGPEKALCLAIGDSPIFVKTKESGKINVITEEKDPGRSVNITFSALDISASMYDIQAYVTPVEGLEAILIMSDGCFGYDKGHIYGSNEAKDFPDWFYAVIRGEQSLQYAVNHLCMNGLDDCAFAYYLHNPIIPSDLSLS